ncbi:MAG: hypothetical protein ACI3T9_03470 [Romboutsia timonensis]
MADLKFNVITQNAEQKINSLQGQIDKLEKEIAKNRELNINTQVAEAQVKGLKNAISSVLKDIAKEAQQNALGTKDLLHTDENIRKLKDLKTQINTLYKDIANTGGTKTQISELNRLNASFNGTIAAIKRKGNAEKIAEAESIKMSKNTINRITDEKKAQEQLAKTEAQRMSTANKSMTEYQKLVNEYISLLKKQENAQKNTTGKNALKPSEEMYMYGYPDGTPRKIRPDKIKISRNKKTI